MKVKLIRSIIVLALAPLFWGCGEDSSPTTVPSWMQGDWQLIYYGHRKIVTLNYHIKFTKNSMTYNIGGCDGEASIEMDPSVPYYATNDYRITITRSNGCEWFNFESILGAVDEGVIWGEYEGEQIHRYSFRQNNTQGPFRWIYSK